MDYATLKSLLSTGAADLVISPRMLTPNVNAFLSEFYAGQPITIRRPELRTDDPDAEVFVIHGISSFLNVADSPTDATFRLDAEGNVQVLLRYLLRGPSPSSADWKFSRSFPNIPTVFDWDDYLDDPRQSALDKLDLRDSYFICSTTAVESYAFAPDPNQEPAVITLGRGINFASHLKPSGPIGVLRSTLGQTQLFTLFGRIVFPDPTGHTSPLLRFESPWDRDEVPGICLQAFLHRRLTLTQIIGSGGSDGLRLEDVAYRIYSPITNEWRNKNRSFEPALAYSAKLFVPSAGIEADITAAMELGGREAILFASLKDFKLRTLAGLVDLVGTGRLLNAMPREIQAPINALGELSLLHVALGIGISDTGGLEITSAHATVGFSPLDWSLWENRFTVREIIGRFGIEDPFGASSKTSVAIEGVTTIEGVSVRIIASNEDGFTAQALLEGKHTIPLRSLLSSYGAGLPTLSDLTVNTLGVTVSPRNYYAFSAAIAQRPDPWILDLGPTSLAVSDLSLNFVCPSGGVAAGSFSGNIALGDVATIGFNYSVPGSNLLLRGSLPEISLRQLVSRLVGDPGHLGIPWPSDFDVRFLNSAILIERSATGLVFRLATVIDGAGTMAFEVRRISAGSDGWGFAFGLDFGSASPATVRGLDFLRLFQDLFQLQSFTLVLCTFDDLGFSFPSFAQFDTPTLPSTGGLSLPGMGGVIRGLNIFASWRFDPTNRQHNLLKDLLKLDSADIAVTLQVGADPRKDSRLYMKFDGKISGQPFTGRFGGQLTNGELGLFLEGEFKVKIQKAEQTFKVKLLFVANGAFMSGSMTGATAVEFGVLKLSNLAVVIGINWEGLPSLGIAATIGVDDFQSSLAIFFDSTNPSKSMVAGSVSELYLRNVVESIAGAKVPSEIGSVLDLVSLEGTQSFSISESLANALDNLELADLKTAFQSAAGITIPSTVDNVLLNVNQKGSVWYLTDLSEMRHYELRKRGNAIRVVLEPQLYFAPQRTELGGLKPFEKGFFVNGKLRWFFLNVETQIEINEGKGILVDTKIDKVVAGSERFFSITSTDGKTGPRLSICTFSRPTYREEKFRDPHFYMDGQITLLGLKRSFHGQITSKGIEFDLTGDLVPGVNLSLKGLLDTSNGLKVTGGYDLGIGKLDLGPLGSVDINTRATGTITFYANRDAFGAGFKGSFEFFGRGFSFDVGFDVSTGSILDMLEMAWNAIVDKLKEFFLDAARWAEAFAKGLIQGVEDATKVLVEVFDQTVAGAEALLKSAAATATTCAMETASIFT